MKIIAKIFLVILFIPIFLAAVVTATFKFQFLNSDFWITTFSENNIYKPLSSKLKKETEIKVEKEGGGGNEIQLLTTLITEENLKITVEKNIINILDYTNGKTQVLNIFLPISLAPKGLLPSGIAKISDEVSIEVLFKEFNIQGFDSKQINTLPDSVRWVFPFFLIEVLALLLIIFIFIKIENPGSKFTGLGFAFLLSGFLLVLGTIGMYVIRGSMFKDWIVSEEPSQQILSTFAPYILGKVAGTWIVIGLSVVIFGFIFFFLKKKVNNSINK